MEQLTSWNPYNLPNADNLNPFAYCIRVDREMFIQKGKMIAYYGNLRFEQLGSGVFDLLVKESFNSPLYARDFVIVSGQGHLILGDRGNDVNSFDLEAGNLTVKAENVLGFESSLLMQESIVEGYLTLLGTGKFLASSNGPVHFLECPVRVDEQALLGWADAPCPSQRFDMNYVRTVMNAVGMMFGRSTGEERQVDFTGQGTVLVQSSEDFLGGRGVLEEIMSRSNSLNHNQLSQLSSYISQKLSGN